MATGTLSGSVQPYASTTSININLVVLDLDNSILIIRYLLGADPTLRTATVNVGGATLNNVKTAIQNAIGTQLGTSVTLS